MNIPLTPGRFLISTGLLLWMIFFVACTSNTSSQPEHLVSPQIVTIPSSTNTPALLTNIPPTMLPTLKTTPDNLASGIYPTSVWTPNLEEGEITNTWVQYMNEAAGYSFKHPSDAVFVASGRVEGEFDAVTGYLPQINSHKSNMIILVYENEENLTASQFLADLYLRRMTTSKVPETYLAHMEPIEINGLPAIWDKANPSSEIYISMVVQNKIFVSYVNSSNDLGGTREMTNEHKDLFFQILNTLTFLPSNDE